MTGEKLLNGRLNNEMKENMISEVQNLIGHCKNSGFCSESQQWQAIGKAECKSEIIWFVFWQDHSTGKEAMEKPEGQLRALL